MKNLQILDIDLTESIDSTSLKSTSLAMQELSEHEEINIVGGGCAILHVYNHLYAY
jgi:hypothetical protein